MTSGADRYASGLNAEALALAYLSANGWQLLGERVRTGAGEIDLIVAKNDALAFVEVKTRADFEAAAYAITPRQQARLFKAGEAWLALNQDASRYQIIRFDAILVNPEGLIQHLENIITAA